MQRHLKPLLLSVVLFGVFYWGLSHYVSINDVQAKPGGGELSALGLGGQDEGPYDLAQGRVLEKVLKAVSNNYIDSNRIKPKEMFLASLEQLSKSVAEIMIQPNNSKTQITLIVDKTQKNFSLENLDNLFELRVAIKEVFSFLEKNLDKKTDLRDIEYSAINGLLSVLDPHTVLLKPDLFADMKTGTRGEFGGLGIQIGIRDGMLTVVAPMEGTPAWYAGLKAKDKIVKIEDESTINMEIDDAVDRLRGKPGTKVSIAVMRKGWNEPQDFSITRDIIKLESVTHETLPGGLGYIQIKNFQGNTFDDLRAALVDLRKKGASRGLILDLRNNPGGLLDQAIKVSDAFLKQGVIVSTEGMAGGRKLREERPATEDGNEYTGPLAVLINAGSASASEIVSGAIKNNRRGVVIGSQSFGKGSVQVLYDFPDGSALKLTIAQYLTPGDISIQGVGVSPDVMLLPSTASKERVVYFSSESFTKEADLDAHLSSTNTPPIVEPKVKIHYFVDPEEGEEARKLLEEDSTAFWEDPEIRFAREFLSSVTGKNGDELISNGKRFFTRYSEQQEQKISYALSDLGIDWTPGQNLSTKGSGTASVRLEKTGNSLLAGDETKLFLTVTNTGSRPLYRVRAETKSDNPIFDNLELFVGKVPVGESRSYEMPIKIPKNSFSRTDEVKFTLFEDGKSAPAPVKETFQIQGLERPIFSYGYRVLDQEGGNGDGLLQVGETVKFVLTVKNIGKGPSYETLATLKSRAGKSLLLKDGRTNINNIAPGDQKTAVFTFDVRALPIRGEVFPLEISILDITLREYVSEKLLFPVYKTVPTIKEEMIGLSIEKEDAELFSGANDKTSVIATLSRGSLVLSKAQVGDFYKIFLADGTIGFLPKTQAKLASVKTERVKTKPHLQNSPPLISLNVDSGTAIKGKTLKLTGSITDDTNIRDMYILLNKKKVFYQSNKGNKGKLKFSSSLPLEVGTNEILVVARETEDVVSREILNIRREK